MARLPRLYAPDTPQLMQLRLARRLANANEATPSAALELIHEWLVAETRRRPVALHGWAILPERIILLATPTHAQALPQLVQALGRQMAARMIHGRVFHERYRSTLVDHAWVPACLVWAESLPVSQGLVDAPIHWPWSSAREHVGLRVDAGLLTDHPAYWALGNTPFARQARYQQLLQTGTTESETVRIEGALSSQWALGPQEFLDWLAARSSRRPAPRPRGRPRRTTLCNTVTN